MLFPLLTGLFGLPALLSVSLGRVPEQSAPVSRDLDGRAALGGALAGRIRRMGSGVTSTTGTMIGSVLDPDRGGDEEDATRRFITMVSSVGTAAAVFGIIALAVTGKGRTGALLVVKQMLGAEGVGALSSATSTETICCWCLCSPRPCSVTSSHCAWASCSRPRWGTWTWTG